jgi:threonylcarbamoyladenosine tRNA methylthiotransferase MtaB
MDHSLKFQVHTFGCKVNTYDTGLLQKSLQGHGYQTFESTESVESIKAQPRIHVLNTCAVTAEATKQAVRYIRRLKVKDPFCTVVVTGCAAQVDTGAFENLPGADLIVANSHKGQLPELLSKYFKGDLEAKVFKSNIFKKEALEAGGGVEKAHTRTFLKIQDGCNSFCTYCIIPFARGKSRSIPIFDLVQRVNQLYSEGVREAVLTGVHIGDYEDTGLGQTKGLEDLLETLLLKTKMPRFRLTSLEPVEVSERLLDLYQDDRMCAHFHMSIQSANTDVLEKMKRKYTQADVQKSLLNIQKRVKNPFIGMDVIVGFPTETLADYEDTVRALKDLPWTKIHVFPFSERPGTRAVTYAETVPVQERQRRASLLRDLSLLRFEAEGRKQTGEHKKVLVLKNSGKAAQSLSRDYWPVQIVGADEFIDHWAGQEIDVKVLQYASADKAHLEGHLVAEVLSEAATAKMSEAIV